MQFEPTQPIYLQISALVCENILLGTWKEEDRIPSIREMAVETEVNPNTVMRTYTHLQDREIIQNKRGIGYFVTQGAVDRTREIKREEFVAHELPRVFRTMELLGMTLGELREYHQTYREGGEEALA